MDSFPLGQSKEEGIGGESSLGGAAGGQEGFCLFGVLSVMTGL